MVFERDGDSSLIVFFTKSKQIERFPQTRLEASDYKELRHYSVLECPVPAPLGAGEVQDDPPLFTCSPQPAEYSLLHDECGTRSEAARAVQLCLITTKLLNIFTKIRLQSHSSQGRK